MIGWVTKKKCKRIGDELALQNQGRSVGGTGEAYKACEACEWGLMSSKLPSCTHVLINYSPEPPRNSLRLKGSRALGLRKRA